MSDRRPSLIRRLAKLGAVAIWVSAALVAGSSPLPKKPPRQSAEEIAAERRSAILTYAVGYCVALTFTLLAFALVYWRWAEPPSALGLVFGLGLMQMLVHFRCFLHIDFNSQSRDDLLLILFSTLIVILMVGGTLVVVLNQRHRMM